MRVIEVIGGTEIVLTLVSNVSLKLATDPLRGNVQHFLERLLVEVVSENYRYFANEHVDLQRKGLSPPAHYCWPPLMANERQVSGLFATGLSRVCPVSRPEHPVSRQPKGDDDGEASTSASGRIDFLALFGSRHIGLEIKRSTISTVGDAKSKSTLTKRWNSVKGQAKSALVHMRGMREEYVAPVTIGLLVIRVNRTVTKRRDPEAERDVAAVALPQIVERVKALTKADFLASYAPPPEMQVSYGWGVDLDQYRVFPGVVFAAVVHGNTR